MCQPGVNHGLRIAPAQRFDESCYRWGRVHHLQHLSTAEVE